MIDKAERDVMRARAIEYRNDPLLASQDALRLWTGKALRLLDALDEAAETVEPVEAAPLECAFTRSAGGWHVHNKPGVHPTLALAIRWALKEVGG